MKAVFQWIKPRTIIRALAVLIIGIAQMIAAQVASKPSTDTSATNGNAGQQQPAADANLPSACMSEGEATQPPAHGPHTVTLSWQASVPVTPKSADAISCYLIYRTGDSFDPKSARIIGVTRAPATTYIDLQVEPGNYLYAVRAVSASAAMSDFSKQLPVQIHP